MQTSLPLCKDIRNRKKKNKKPVKTDIKCDADIEKVCQMLNSAGKSKNSHPKLTCKDNEIITNVDSGTVATVANASKAFPKHAVEPSPDSKKKCGLRCSRRGGGLMPNRGQVSLNVRTENGIEIPDMKWQDAPVNMPILSMKCFAKKGSRFTFHDTGGHIRLPCGRKIPFYLVNCVYLIKLIVDPPKGSDMPSVGGQGSYTFHPRSDRP